MTASRHFDQTVPDHVDTNDPTTSWPANDFTVMAWVRFADGQPTASQTICAMLDSGATSGLQFYLETTGRITSTIWAGGTANAQPSAVLADGQLAFKHFALRQNWTADQMDLYIDGVKQTLDSLNGSTAALNPASYSAPGDIFLGARNRVGVGIQLPSTCEMADYRRYNRALSDAEIQEIARGNMRAFHDSGLITEMLMFGRLEDARGAFSPTNSGSDDSAYGPPIYGSF